MRSTIIIFIFLFFFNFILFAQENTNDLKLLDSFSRYNCEYLRYTLDSTAVEVYQKPNSIAYLVIYGAENVGQNKDLELAVRNHIKFRRIDKDRFIILTAKSETELKVDIWISVSGKTKPNIREENLSYNLGKIDKPVLFGRDMVEIAKIDKKLTYLGTSECYSINLYFLSEFLKANPQTDAHVKIYARSRNYAQKLEKLVRNEMLNDIKIPAERFRISYRGSDEEIKESPKNFAILEIEFVPNK